MKIKNDFNSILNQVKKGMKLVSTPQEKLKSKGTPTTTAPTTTEPGVKHPLEFRHEFECVIYNAICMIEGTDEIRIWTTEKGLVNFKFKWHDTTIIGKDDNGIISLKTGDNKSIGSYYRSINTGNIVVENKLGKKWSKFIMYKLAANMMMTDKHIVTFPTKLTIDNWTMESKENRIVLNDEIVVMYYDCCGKLWNSTPNFPSVIEFINKNFIK